MLPLKFQPTTSLPIMLFRLTPIASSTGQLLVALHTTSELYVYARWSGETERFGEFNEVKLMYVEDGAEGVRGVSLDVGAVAVFG